MIDNALIYLIMFLLICLLIYVIAGAVILIIKWLI